MKKLDKFIAILFFIVFVLSYVYMSDNNKVLFLVTSGILFCIFFYLSFFSKDNSVETAKIPMGAISALGLLDEENNPIAYFDIYGKVGVIIGKDNRYKDVDINLSSSTFASTIDDEHAVLNYADNNWYIEDLYSKNGIAIMKRNDEKKYNLSPNHPCKIEMGDTLFIGLTKLLVR